MWVPRAVLFAATHRIPYDSAESGEPMRAIPILFLLAGCVTAQQQSSSWLRADGRTGSDRQLEADRAICMGERQNTSDVDQLRRCMAQRGWLPADQP
ncbi:MAG: hypothetical protein K2Z80_16570 [Xanthobacteraceae bacterium]|nr:hypothetical protein [Xanthobacteraceae bacterium]